MKDKDGAEIIVGEKYECLEDCHPHKKGEVYAIVSLNSGGGRGLWTEKGICCHEENWRRVTSSPAPTTTKVTKTIQPLLKIGDIVEVVQKEALVEKFAEDCFIKRCGMRGRITGGNLESGARMGYYIDFSENDLDDGGETFFFRSELILIKRTESPADEPPARSIAEEFIRQEYYIGADPAALPTNEPNTMQALQSLSIALQKVLSPSKKKQFRAGFLDSNLMLTQKGKDLLWTLLAEQFDKELTAAAQEELDAEKK